MKSLNFILIIKNIFIKNKFKVNIKKYLMLKNNFKGLKNYLRNNLIKNLQKKNSMKSNYFFYKKLSKNNVII